MWPRDEIKVFQIVENVLVNKHKIRDPTDDPNGSGLANEIVDDLLPWLAATIRQAEIDAVREYADQLGVYVGDEEGEYYRGYRQAQREAMHRAQRYVDQMAAGGADHG